MCAATNNQQRGFNSSIVNEIYNVLNDIFQTSEVRGSFDKSCLTYARIDVVKVAINLLQPLSQKYW